MGIITLKDLAKEYNKLGITWWLMYGSLLSAVRDGKRDKYDVDIDIGIYAENFPKIKDIGNGFVAPFYWNYGKDPIINVQAWKIVDGHRYYCQDDWMQTKLPAYISFGITTLDDVNCPIPANYEELLNDWFSNWKVPMKEKARTRIYQIQQVKFENEWKI